MSRRFPRWAIWAGLTLAVWVVWLTALRGPMTRMVTKLEQQKLATERRLEELKARLDNVPVLVSRLDATYAELARGTRAVARVADIDQLVTDLRTGGGRWGLRDVSVEPDLGSLLSIGRADETEQNGWQLDTLLVDMEANADFISTGRWMDSIENRRDFQRWLECRWSDPDGDGTVTFTAKAAVLVINGPDSIEPLMGLTNGHN